MFWFIAALAAVTLVYYVSTDRSKTDAPRLSVVESWKLIFQLIFQRKNQAIASKEIYDRFDGHRYYESYRLFMPTLVLRDPDLIKQITVKDFDYFVDRSEFISTESEPLMSKALFFLRGEKWREMRATLSPSFTGSKMRAMFGLMVECAQQFTGHFENGDAKTIEIEFKDAFTRYANDVIASTAFGIDCDSMKDKENEFYLMGKEATTFRGFWTNLRFFLMSISPRVARLLGMSILPKHVSAFFRRLVKTNVESREKNEIVRPDMIHLLMEARKGRLKHEETNEMDNGFAAVDESFANGEEKQQKTQLSDDDIAAQTLAFFFAGFDSVSTLMSFTIYEIAANPDVQAKLQEEIDETLQNCNGSVTYEALLKMSYMDKVISESLRKWPVNLGMDRACVKPYTIQPIRPHEKPIALKKGHVVWMPYYAIHHDPRFYPEPERFDPERFSEENKRKIPAYSYLPFGTGPRNCVGNRFALMEVKIAFFFLLAKFNVVVLDKSPVPMKLATDQFNLAAEKDYWFGLESRIAN